MKNRPACFRFGRIRPFLLPVVMLAAALAAAAGAIACVEINEPATAVALSFLAAILFVPAGVLLFSPRRWAYRARAATISVLAVMAVAAVLDRAGLLAVRGSDRKLYDGRTFRVVRVVDGDTLILDATDRNGRKLRVRLRGVDTPETVHPDITAGLRPIDYFGPEATRFTRSRVEGKRVRVEIGPAPCRDENGRLLAYIYLPDGSCLNEQLISLGYGYADPRFPHPLRKKFKRLQTEARRERRGLWAAVKPHQLPPWIREDLGIELQSSPAPK